MNPHFRRYHAARPSIINVVVSGHHRASGLRNDYRNALWRHGVLKILGRPLAMRGPRPYLLPIELRPNDLASPRTARLTDEILPKISTKTVVHGARLTTYVRKESSHD